MTRAEVVATDTPTTVASCVVEGTTATGCQDEHALAFVGGTDGRCGKSRPLRIVPEVGKVSEDCPGRSEHSHIIRGLFHVIGYIFFATGHLYLGFGGEKAPHVFNDHDRWLQHRDGVGEVGPQARPRSLPEACPASGRRHVLAGKASAQNVDRLDLGPIHLGDVAEVGRTWALVFEDLNGGRIDLGVPRDLGVEHHGDGNIEHAHATEQGADLHQLVPYPVKGGKSNPSCIRGYHRGNRSGAFYVVAGMNINEIAAKIDPDKARLAIAHAMVALGSELDWDSETIEHVASALSPAFPADLPNAFDQDQAAVEFWQDINYA